MQLRRTVTGTVLSTLIAATPLAAAPLTAWADTPGPITVNLTVDPPATTVGGQVTLTATLTNNTATVASGALGIDNPNYANQHITSVSPGCRNLSRLIYCGNPQLQPGATMTLKVTLTAKAPGTDQIRAYGRITNVSDVYAYGTLTVS